MNISWGSFPYSLLREEQEILLRQHGIEKEVPRVELPTRTFASILTRMSIPPCPHGFNAMPSSLFLHCQGSWSTSTLLPGTWHFWDSSPVSDLYPSPDLYPCHNSVPYLHTLLDLFDELCNVYPPFDLLQLYRSNRQQFMEDIVWTLSNRTRLWVLLVSWVTLRSLEQ